MYSKALERARAFIYVEDQYFWSEEIASLYEAALKRRPDLRIIVVVPRHPDRNGRISGPTNRLGQLTMMERLAEAGGNRVAIYDIENEDGVAIYVHAKVVIIDDVLAMLGSDNMNRRSWTHDSELSIAVLDEEEDGREPRDPAGLGDGARRFARDLRLRLWREHLGSCRTTVSSTCSEASSAGARKPMHLTLGTTAGKTGPDREAASAIIDLDRCLPGSAPGRGRCTGPSSTPTAAPERFGGLTGSNRH